MRLLLSAAALFSLCGVGFAASVPPLVCSSGGPVAKLDLKVVSADPDAKPLPLRTINRLEEGDTLTYRPVLRPGEERHGDVALVLVPAEGVHADEPLLILDEKPANRPQQWKVPWRTGLVAFVYGPSGLSVKKVRGFLSRDTEVVGELADYAEKTSRTEALLAELSSPNASSERVQSALQGFASQFGLNVPTVRNAPINEQALTLFQAVNPALANYDPLAAQPTTSARETASLATSVGELFFGSPVGLAAGGTALLLNLRSVAFPNSEFRSSFSQPLSDDALGLCGKTSSVPPHTRVAWLWAMRVPNAAPPQLTVGKENSLPAGVKSPLPISVSDTAWKFIDHARDWMLQAGDGKSVPAKVQEQGNTKKLELDLSGITPGRYSLHANWDWDHFDVNGVIDVRPLSAFATTRVSSSSQDNLVANTGKVPITLDAGNGSDFEFVTKVEIERLHDEFAAPSSIPFILPEGLRSGVQEQMDIQIDTASLPPGQYKLILTQVDEKPHDVPLELLPPAPTIDNLPMVINQGVSESQFVLKGRHLELLKHLDTAKGNLELGPGSPDQTERQITLRMPKDLSAGTGFAVRAYIADRSEPLTFADAIRIAGPLPEITAVNAGWPADQVVQLGSGELPGGSFLSAMLTVAHLESNGIVKLACDQAGSRDMTIPLGASSGNTRAQQVRPDQVFLSFDTVGWPNGCVLKATIANGSEGQSVPYTIGRVVLVPKIENLNLTADDSGDAVYRAVVSGENLETIEKIGWAADQGEAVGALPLSVGAGQKQTLTTSVPAPPDPDSQLFVWLRGEDKPRVTTVRAALPK